jgi:hypothetical protein
MLTFGAYFIGVLLAWTGAAFLIETLVGRIIRNGRR